MTTPATRVVLRRNPDTLTSRMLMNPLLSRLNRPVAAGPQRSDHGSDGHQASSTGSGEYHGFITSASAAEPAGEQVGPVACGRPLPQCLPADLRVAGAELADVGVETYL